MGWGLVTALVIVAVIAVIWRSAAARARRRRLDERRALIERVGEALGRVDSALELGEAAADSLIVYSPSGGEASLPWGRLTDAPSLDGLAESVEIQISSSARPHREALALNKQARNLAPLVVRRDWLTWFPGGSPPHTVLEETGLCVIYRFLEDPEERGSALVYLDHTSLEATGLDVEGLHGAMMALLGQRLDEEPIRGLGPEDAPLVLEDTALISAAYLFLLPELLEDDGELVALLPGPGRLVLAHPDRLDAAVETASSGSGPPAPDRAWLLDLPVIVRPDGIRLAKASRRGG